MTLRERVARAMCRADNLDYLDAETLDGIVETEWVLYEALADAAIAALRQVEPEPTDHGG